MAASHVWARAEDRSEALARCSRLLTQEGFRVAVPGTTRNPPTPDLIASRGRRTVRVVVLSMEEVDETAARRRVHDLVRTGETRVYVPWPLRWRFLSNLDRWRLRGVAVVGW